MKKKLTGILASAVIALGLGLASAPAASAHPYVNGCLDTHTSAGYRNTILWREVYRTTGATAYRVNTRWHTYNYLTKEIHYHHTARACFRPGLGF